MSDPQLSNPSDHKPWQAPHVTSTCPSCGLRETRRPGSWACREDGTIHARMGCGSGDCYRTWDLEVPAPTPERTTDMTLNALAADIHANAKAKGFWDDDRPFSESVVLMHAELSEAIEEHRAGRHDVWHRADGKPEGVPVELVDCLIRILDTLAAQQVDIDALVAEKHAYNRTRPHLHGKAY